MQSFAAGDGDAGAMAGEEFSDAAVDTAGAADNDNGYVRKIERVVHRGGLVLGRFYGVGAVRRRSHQHFVGQQLEI